MVIMTKIIIVLLRLILMILLMFNWFILLYAQFVDLYQMLLMMINFKWLLIKNLGWRIMEIIIIISIIIIKFIFTKFLISRITMLIMFPTLHQVCLMLRPINNNNNDWLHQLLLVTHKHAFRFHLITFDLMWTEFQLENLKKTLSTILNRIMMLILRLLTVVLHH